MPIIIDSRYWRHDSLFTPIFDMLRCQKQKSCIYSSFNVVLSVRSILVHLDRLIVILGATCKNNTFTLELKDFLHYMQKFCNYNVFFANPNFNDVRDSIHNKLDYNSFE